MARGEIHRGRATSASRSRTAPSCRHCERPGTWPSGSALVDALVTTRGNITQASRLLAVSRPTIHGLIASNGSTRRTSADRHPVRLGAQAPTRRRRSPGGGGHQRRGGDREDPRPEDTPGHSPAHGGEALDRADAHDRPADRLRRADRECPPMAVPISVRAPAVSAQNPPTGRSLVMRMPIVFTMRQPAGHRAQRRARRGRPARPRTARRTPAPRWPVVKSSTAMMPIVFCASLVPCPRL